MDIDSQDVKIAIKSAVVQRYCSVLETLLDIAEGPVHSSCAAEVIRTKAAVEDLKVMPWRHARYLSDAAMDFLPTRWLMEHFPASKGKRTREFSSWIDQAGHARTKPVSSTTFALALALLWDDPDVAVGAFLGANRDSPATTRATAARTKLDDQAMRTLWLRHRGHHMRISEDTGISYQRVQKNFGEVGLHALGRVPFELVQAANARFLRGESLVRACAAEGVEIEMVETLVRARQTETQAAVLAVQVRPDGLVFTTAEGQPHRENV